MTTIASDVKTGVAAGSIPDPVESGAVVLKHKRRYCRVVGCGKIVKSQGLCQRHGAKPKSCKVPGCTKQAQGNFDKMCKAHFKAMKRQTTPIPKVIKNAPPQKQGQSVYDDILPRSISFSSAKGGTMPLIAHLKHGFDTLKPPAWHRNEERAARGIFQIDNPAQQLEGWERELVWMEILVLTGVPGASFRHLARAWGRDKGFHMVLAQFICQRHGDVERKKRQAASSVEADNERQNVPAKKRKIRKLPLTLADIGADVWDSCQYGDVDTNEALAAEIFDFSEKEFHRVTSKYKGRASSVGSDSGSTSSLSIAAQASSLAKHAAMNAILGDKSEDTSQLNLPEAAVALAAMNQISAQTPQHGYVSQGQALQNPPSETMTSAVRVVKNVAANVQVNIAVQGLPTDGQNQQPADAQAAVGVQTIQIFDVDNAHLPTPLHQMKLESQQTPMLQHAPVQHSDQQMHLGQQTQYGDPRQTQTQQLHVQHQNSGGQCGQQLHQQQQQGVPEQPLNQMVPQQQQQQQHVVPTHPLPQQEYTPQLHPQNAHVYPRADIHHNQEQPQNIVPIAPRVEAAPVQHYSQHVPHHQHEQQQLSQQQLGTTPHTSEMQQNQFALQQQQSHGQQPPLQGQQLASQQQQSHGQQSQQQQQQQQQQLVSQQQHTSQLIPQVQQNQHSHASVTQQQLEDGSQHYQQAIGQPLLASQVPDQTAQQQLAPQQQYSTPADHQRQQQSQHQEMLPQLAVQPQQQEIFQAQPTQQQAPLHDGTIQNYQTIHQQQEPNQSQQLQHQQIPQQYPLNAQQQQIDQRQQTHSQHQNPLQVPQHQRGGWPQDNSSSQPVYAAPIQQQQHMEQHQEPTPQVHNMGLHQDPSGAPHRFGETVQRQPLAQPLYAQQQKQDIQETHGSSAPQNQLNPVQTTVRQQGMEQFSQVQLQGSAVAQHLSPGVHSQQRFASHQSADNPRHHRRQLSQPAYFHQPGPTSIPPLSHRRQHSQPAYLHDLALELPELQFSKVNPQQDQTLHPHQQSQLQHNTAPQDVLEANGPSQHQFQQGAHHSTQADNALHDQQTPQSNHDGALLTGAYQQPQNAQSVSYERPTHAGAQEDLVQDPLDVHHEMHVAEASASHYQEHPEQN